MPVPHTLNSVNGIFGLAGINFSTKQYGKEAAQPSNCQLKGIPCFPRNIAPRYSKHLFAQFSRRCFSIKPCKERLDKIKCASYKICKCISYYPTFKRSADNMVDCRSKVSAIHSSVFAQLCADCFHKIKRLASGCAYHVTKVIPAHLVFDANKPIRNTANNVTDRHIRYKISQLFNGDIKPFGKIISDTIPNGCSALAIPYG